MGQNSNRDRCGRYNSNEVDVIISAMTNNRLDYIWNAHPKPWFMSSGKLNYASIKDGMIKVNFTVSKHEARKNIRWDQERDRVLLEVKDSDGRVVIDNWVNFDDKGIVTATMCLGDSNAI